MTITNPAGFQNRFLARVLDSLIIFIGVGIISYFIYGKFYDSEIIYPIDYAGLIYGILLPIIWYGYTLGRRMAGNRIVRVDGKKVGIGTMLLRDILGGIIYILTLGIGLIISAFMIGVREDKRTIHDLIAQTYVTTEPPKKSQ
ncbi:RDD family protein [Virgibacillus halodenitrificans]|uniref:RDD family protein n=1 Tax=Virgibacillus halodenitrificans TaxID=1482 RepID=UPI001F2997A8|nr:RDD family protein [Virgibacillus halodenitrificans]MCG1028520.1 RDD family protein [Virgibacillus halodenitrificans]